jgi:hypothetical protein
MGFTLWIRMLDCNQTSKQNRNSILVAREREHDTGQLIKNEGKTEEERFKHQFIYENNKR